MKKITSKTLLQVYLYVICLITLTASMFSGAYLIQVGLSYVTPIQFSYILYPTYSSIEKEEMNLQDCAENSEVVDIDGETYCWDENNRTEGLINSMTIFASMVILLLIHIVAIKRTEENEYTLWIKKSYTFLSLMIYSIVGVIIIPTAIYQLVNFFLTKTGEYSTQYAPAYSLGLVILSLPLWFIFFKKTNRLKA